MAQENILVTGKHGSDHITSAQMGAIQAGFMGDGSYINTGLEATVVNANTITVGVGVATVNGRSYVISSPTDLTVTSGMTGKNRNDLIVLHYQKDSVGAVPEAGSIKVITGTPTSGTATDPAYESGSILNGDTSVDFPLYRVEVRGIAAPNVVKIAQVLPSLTNLATELNTLRDSISHDITSSFSLVYPAYWGSTSRFFEFGGLVIARIMVQRTADTFNLSGSTREKMFKLPDKYSNAGWGLLPAYVAYASNPGYFFEVSGGYISLGNLSGGSVASKQWVSCVLMFWTT